MARGGGESILEGYLQQRGARGSCGEIQNRGLMGTVWYTLVFLSICQGLRNPLSQLTNSHRAAEKGQALLWTCGKNEGCKSSCPPGVSMMRDA